MIDRSTTMRVSSSAHATPRPFSLSSAPVYDPVLRKRLRSEDRHQPLSLLPTDARLCPAILTSPKFQSPGLHLELLRDPSLKTRFHFYPITPHPRRPRASSNIPRLQYFICPLSIELELLNYAWPGILVDSGFSKWVLAAVISAVFDPTRRNKVAYMSMVDREGFERREGRLGCNRRMTATKLKASDDRLNEKST